jgi:hypothetical protein
MRDHDLHITGDVNGALAMGTGATANQYGGPILGSAQGPDVLAAVAHLRRLVEADIGQVPQASLVRRDFDELEAEVRRADPDPEKLEGYVDRIKRRAAAVGGVTAAAGSVWALIEQIVA